MKCNTIFNWSEVVDFVTSRGVLSDLSCLEDLISFLFSKYRIECLNGDVECLPAKRVPDIEKILKQLYQLYKSTIKAYSNEFDKHPESHDSDHPPFQPQSP
jgi:hypothetical protein